MGGHAESSALNTITAAAGPSNASSPARNAHSTKDLGGLSPPIALSKRTSSKNALRETYQDGLSVGGQGRRSNSVSSPPTTPPPRRARRESKKKGKQPARAHAALAGINRETGGGFNPRHSHGLSWSSTTRDSVVDNLLFSLDNLSRGDVDEKDREPDVELERLKSMFSSAPSMPVSRTAQRARGHTYSSSLSSDYDRIAMPDTPSTFSSKERRSNSSSNFPRQHSLNGRMWSAQKPMGPGRASTDTQKTATRGDVGHERHESDMSSDNLGFSTITTERIKPGRRSMSMDQLYTEPGRNGPSMLDRGRPVPSVHSTYETNGDASAAPEPGVPSGPRRMQNPAGAGPVYVGQTAAKTGAARKMPTQNDLRAASNPIPSPPIPLQVRNQASDFVRLNSMRGGGPCLPSHTEISGGRVASPGLQSNLRGGPESTHKEKPGFFKRVFGGGGGRSASNYSNRAASMEYSDLATVPTNRESGSAGSQPKMQSRQALKETKSEPTYPPVSLNKKPSSFFRRRKKSADETAPPPPLPVNANLKINGNAAQPSPSISSLRKVMDPFLADGAPAGSQEKERSLSRPETTESSTAEDSDNPDMFHSGYTPPIGASLGNRDPLSRATSIKPKQSVEQGDSPQGKMKIRKRKPESLQQQGYFAPDPNSLQVESADVPAVSPLTEYSPNNKENDRPPSRASTGDRIIAMSKPTSEETRRNASASSAELGEEVEDGFVRLSSERPESKKSKKSERLFLQPTASEEMPGNQDDQLSPVVEGSREVSVVGSQKSPALGTATSETFASALASPRTPSERFHSATSLPLPSVKVDGHEPRKSVEANGLLVESSLPSSIVDEGAEYRERARKIFDGDEEDVLKSEAASWLGETNTLSRRTLQAFMQLFDLSGQNILAALRTLCGKLLLKGETQQFDRIITALSGRWCECNPNHGFKAQDVVHTIFYSVILLNTDLHLADIGEKMSRSAYVKNTLPTIKRVVADAAPNAFDDTIRPNPNTSRPTLPWTNSTGSIPPETPDRTSLDGERPTLGKRLSMRPDFLRQNSDGWAPDAAGMSSANLLVNQPWNGPMRSWEVDVETVLKSFYASIRSEPLPLHGSAPPLEYPRQERNLLAARAGGLKRSGSIVSKAPSDNASFRSKPGFRTMTMGFQNKYGRSRPKIYPTSTHGSSRTSFDEGSVWSPVNSSNWSKYSLNKTLTSASMQSLSHFSPTTADFKHSIGFANALSQAIIREESGNNPSADGESVSMSVPGGLLEDEALALEGAPWAKEGLVKHKHHLETTGKKAKERNWSDVFAVISKGKLTLFAFNTSSTSHNSSLSRKALSKSHPTTGRAASGAGARVGGGDWMENAEQLDVFVLRQTIASTLPPPGYSKARPHVWALSLPSGAVHLFQVGTEDIAAEFMSCANYWSARLSKEPLQGGVSNIEYGWSDAVINTAALERPESASPPATGQGRHVHSSSQSGMPRPSVQSSIRSSFDHGGAAGRSRLPGDKVALADWAPPSQSMMASQLMEVDQLRALRAYVAGMEQELALHNELKQGIELAVSGHRPIQTKINALLTLMPQYSPRSTNFAKAMANWQRKSDYLLREIVKFQTYADSLAAAQGAKEEFYRRRGRVEEVLGRRPGSGGTAAKGEAKEGGGGA